MIRKPSLWLVFAVLLVLAGHQFAVAGTVLVLRGSGKEFEQVVLGINEGLSGEHTCKELIVSDGFSVATLQSRLSELNPVLVVLMDNRSIGLYRDYVSAQPDSGRWLPVIASVGVFVDKEIETIPNACAVTYEVPPVTALVSLRAVLGRDITRVGVVSRAFMSPYLLRQKVYCSNEGINLINIVVPDTLSNPVRTVWRAIRTLAKKERVEALWVPNDNILLTPELIRECWGRVASHYRIPSVVGVEVLVNPLLDFGALGILPDHIALGAQIADRIRVIEAAGWTVEPPLTEPPLSVVKILNYSQMHALFGVDRSVKQIVDKVLE